MSKAACRRGCVFLAIVIGGLRFAAAAEVGAKDDGHNARMPATEAETRYWLENMVWYHEFTLKEVSAATGMTTENIDAALEKFKITRNNRPQRAEGSPLLVLPYPGGRHPRIGFLNGAVDPQRETKISIFAPWDQCAYVVADIPEAIWSNLGLTYLAHTHVDTIWTKQGVTLPRLEWDRRDGGTLEMARKLPNGIACGTRVRPTPSVVLMEQWLTNGTERTLSGLRVQNCVLLKALPGFAQLSNDNKVFHKPYAACRNEAGDRWIITAWVPCERLWANPRCPCLHSDPTFPDCQPGHTTRLRGWLSFYEGKNIEAEIRRIEATGWSDEKASTQ